jgi:hypothetical protein
MMLRRLPILLTGVVILAMPACGPAQDPLPSWNEGPRKQAILDFVRRATREGGPDFVPVAERIATFDHDGTLWSEQPIYFQFEFAQDRIRALAGKHPDWKDKQPFRAALEGNIPQLLAGGNRGLYEMMIAGHTGMSTDTFEKIVLDWTATARHPRFKRPYTDLVYQPMLELLAYLRQHGFQVWIVSGGGIDFMRPWTERVYGIPRAQVVGSSVKVKYVIRDGKPLLLRLAEIDFIDDQDGKPVGIHKFIDRRPIAAFGNSDHDIEMLEWTTAGAGARFGMIVHHTDAEREWAYDRESLVGRLDKALDAAPRRGWAVVDMKKDWKVIYPFQK